jgi:hypothetical protein
MSSFDGADDRRGSHVSAVVVFVAVFVPPPFLAAPGAGVAGGNRFARRSRRPDGPVGVDDDPETSDRVHWVL